MSKNTKNLPCLQITLPFLSPKNDSFQFLYDCLKKRILGSITTPSHDKSPYHVFIFSEFSRYLQSIFFSFLFRVVGIFLTQEYSKNKNYTNLGNLNSRFFGNPRESIFQDQRILDSKIREICKSRRAKICVFRFLAKPDWHDLQFSESS